MARGLAYTAAAAVTFALAIPLAILLLLDPATLAATTCSSPAGSGPATVAGVPTGYLPDYEGAAQQFSLGPEGWAYLAAINQAETDFGTDDGPASGVLSGTNSAGAAGPMQLGVGGAAGEAWQTFSPEIPANLPGGAEPPSVYNEADAVYAAAAKLSAQGAPGDWPAALLGWNDDPAEWAQIDADVAAYTEAPAGGIGAPITTPIASGSGSGAGCVPGGPTVPGAVATIDPQTGLAAIPEGAPGAVQAMIAAGNRIISEPYSWGGGHCLAATAGPSGIQACPGAEENGAAGYDCSGAVEDVLYNAGGQIAQLADGFPSSGGLMDRGVPGTGQWITVYASAGHAFIEVAGVILDTSHYTSVAPASPATGPRWQPAQVLAQQLADGNTWVAIHPEGF